MTNYEKEREEIPFRCVVLLCLKSTLAAIPSLLILFVLYLVSVYTVFELFGSTESNVIAVPVTERNP